MVSNMENGLIKEKEIFTMETLIELYDERAIENGPPRPPGRSSSFASRAGTELGHQKRLEAPQNPCASPSTRSAASPSIDKCPEISPFSLYPCGPGPVNMKKGAVRPNFQ